MNLYLLDRHIYIYIYIYQDKNMNVIGNYVTTIYKKSTKFLSVFIKFINIGTSC